MKNIYFVRHGESVMNKQGIFAGLTETPLTTEGKNQAKRAGLLAKSLNIDYIVSSTQGRAIQTAEIIANEIGLPIDKIELNGLFVERAFGELEGTPWSATLSLEGLSGIEPYDDLINRANKAYKHLETIESNNILVVSHGSLGRALRYVINNDIPFSSQNRLRNAEIVKFL